MTVSLFASGSAFLYALCRCYHGFGGTVGMFGTRPHSRMNPELVKFHFGWFLSTVATLPRSWGFRSRPSVSGSCSYGNEGGASAPPLGEVGVLRKGILSSVKTRAWRSDLSKHSTQHLLAVENELNNRPRLVLNDRAPAELFGALLTSQKPFVLRR
jgi:hypothetical protein